MPKDTAYLASRNDYISFTYGDKVIRFKGPFSLERISKVVNWDHGYIVVQAKYNHSEDEIEDYIDLLPILNNLYIESDSFLAPIKRVEVKYA